MKKIIIGIACTVLSTTLLAKPILTESEIELNGGQAGYNQAVKISLENLLEYVQYHVICLISSNHKSTQTYDDIQIFSEGMPAGIYRVNGTELEAHGQVNIPTKGSSEMIASRIFKSTKAIYVRNLDDTDTITVEMCYAEPARS